MANDDSRLRKGIDERTDDELLEMLTRDYADYRVDALSLARAELKRRGYDDERLVPGRPSTSSFERMTDAIDASRTELTGTDFVVPDLRARIRAQGLDAEAAEQMSSRLTVDQTLRRARVARRLIATGLLMSAVGGLLTLMSYISARQVAESSGRGKYVAFSGLMLVGAALTLRGVLQRRGT